MGGNVFTKMLEIAGVGLVALLIIALLLSTLSPILLDIWSNFWWVFVLFGVFILYIFVEYMKSYAYNEA